MYIRKVKGGYRVEVERLGQRVSKTLPTKREAENWGAKEEGDILAQRRGVYPRKTLAEALKRYREEVSPRKQGERSEGLRFDAIERDFPELARKVICDIATPDLVAWRDARLKTVTPGTVQRDINLLRNVFSVARDEWHWCGHHPFKGMRMPGDNPSRTRRVTPAEVKLIVRRCGYRTGDVSTKLQEVGFAFLLALRTGMRAGELLSLEPKTVDLERRVARVPHKTQYLTGKMREVPLTKAAVRLLRPMMSREKVFTVSSKSLDKLFRDVRESLLLGDLHFHDSRAEALTRLARKVDVMTLARISGHKDLRILLDTYYRESASDIAARLG